MITYSAAGFWIDAISGCTPRIRDDSELSPDIQDAKIATRRIRLPSVRSALARAASLVIRQAARLVPASIDAAFSAHMKSRALASNIKRLEDIAPHLLNDIGIEQVAPGVYAMIDTSDPVVDTLSVPPTAAEIEMAPARRAVSAAPRQAWQASTKRPAQEFAAAAMS